MISPTVACSEHRCQGRDNQPLSPPVMSTRPTPSGRQRGRVQTEVQYRIWEAADECQVFFGLMQKTAERVTQYRGGPGCRGPHHPQFSEQTPWDVPLDSGSKCLNLNFNGAQRRAERPTGAGATLTPHATCKLFCHCTCYLRAIL